MKRHHYNTDVTQLISDFDSNKQVKSSPYNLRTSKEILQEYFDISTLLHHDVAQIHREISSALTAIDPHTEYESFTQQNR